MTAIARTSRLAAVDMIAFLSLALGIGLTSGIVLGAAVLLLADADPTAAPMSGTASVAVR